MLRKLSDYIQDRPLLFGVLLTAVLSLTVSTVNLPDQSKSKHTKNKSTEKDLVDDPSIQLRKVASVEIKTREIASTEFRQLQQMNDEKLRKNLEGQRGAWFVKNQDYSFSIEKIESFDKRNAKKIPEKFERNPLFRLFENLTDSEARVDVEDPLVCDRSRQFYELKLTANPISRDLAVPRKTNEEDFSPQCVAFSMNQFNVPKSNYAYCENAQSPVSIPGAKPCVSSNLVNLTYNVFSDVTSCLGLDPKFLMPKIDFESGFFLNAFGSDKDGGLGQLTRPALTEVNNQWDRFIALMEKKSESNEACARIKKSRDLLTSVPVGADQRCAVMALPENPLRNTWYMGVYNIINAEQVEEHFHRFNIHEKLMKLGIAPELVPEIKKMISLLGYNTGALTAVRILNTYLEKRSEYGLKLAAEDFDFSKKVMKADIDGKERTEVEIARLNLLSSFIGIRDSAEVRKIKLERRRMLPAEWATAFEKSFPIFVTYRANSYDGSSTKPYSIYGYPGYLSVLSERNDHIRRLFSNSEYSPDMCVNKNFLKFGNE